MPRAVQFEQYGDVDVLQVVEAERPEPAEGQLLIRVHAAGINPFDYKLRRGLMEGLFPFQFPSLQGTDVAGVVEAVGPGVEDFALGDEIAGSTGKRGAQADYAVLSAGNAVKRPAGIAWEVAGGIWTVGTTAAAMVRAGGVSADDVVLVSAAAGGVGGLVIQLAGRLGATVIGVASERNHEWLRSHGVLPVTYGDGVEGRVAAAAAMLGRSPDVVLDAAGGGYVELGIELGVAPERINTIVDFEAAEKFGAKAEGGQAASSPKVVGDLLDRVLTGELEFPVHATFALDQVREAYTELEQRHPFGKIVLVP